MSRSIEYLSADGVTPLATQEKDWGVIVAGATDAEKRWIRNTGTVALGSGFTLQLVDPLINGGVGIFKHALDTTTVRPPYGGAAVEGIAGGAFSAVTWYFIVWRINAAGETQPSVEFSYLVTDTAKKIALSWVLPAGPAGTGVKVAASLTSGDYSAADILIASLGASVTSYEWDGTAPSGGTLPVENTTDGESPDYGTAPTLGVADLLMAAVAVGEARPFWKGYSLPASAASVTYHVNTHPVEL